MQCVLKKSGYIIYSRGIFIEHSTFIHSSTKYTNDARVTSNMLMDYLAFSICLAGMLLDRRSMRMRCN